MKKVELFYDVISPYSWVGFEVLCRYAQKWPIELILRPTFIAGVMQASGNKPPGIVPMKARYMTEDLFRIGAHYKLPFKQPANVAEVLFKKGSLQPMRYLTALDLLQPNGSTVNHSGPPTPLEALTRELWLRIWSQDKDITTPESLREAGVAAGLTEAVISRCLADKDSQPVKDRLKATTQEAVDHGAFGMPTIVIHTSSGSKMVFGSDRFHIVADLLGETYVGPLNELSRVKPKL